MSVGLNEMKETQFRRADGDDFISNIHIVSSFGAGENKPQGRQKPILSPTVI